jgi:hypothetical protein
MNTDVNSGIQAGGLEVVDGEQSINTSSRGSQRLNYLNSNFNPCAELKQALLDEKLKRAGNSSKMVW